MRTEKIEYNKHKKAITRQDDASCFEEVKD